MLNLSIDFSFLVTKSQKLSLENQIKVTGEKTSEHSKSTVN